MTTTQITRTDWILQHYSRSRPSSSVSTNSSKSKQGSRGGYGAATKTGSEKDKIEWERFDQPQLALHLETISTGTRQQSRSINLSVTFTRNEPPCTAFDASSQLAGSSSSTATFESLVLTSFFTPAIQRATPPGQLPLKLVYKSTVVGIRYAVLVPGSRGAEDTVDFKRFQAKFATVEERIKFVKAVEGVMPCKAGQGQADDIGGANGGEATTRQQTTQGALVDNSSSTSNPQDQYHSPQLHSSNYTDQSRQQQFSPPPPKTSPDFHRSSSISPSTSSTRTGQTVSHYQPQPLNQPPAPPQHLQSAPPAPLPPAVATLLPSLANSLRPTPPTASTLANLSVTDMSQLLRATLEEEGFSQLIEKVISGLREAREAQGVSDV